MLLIDRLGSTPRPLFYLRSAANHFAMQEVAGQVTTTNLCSDVTPTLKLLSMNGELHTYGDSFNWH